MIKKSYTIKAPVTEVWDALVNPKIIAKWTGAKAVMEPSENTEFKIWGGDIFGKNIEVVKEKKLVQEWSAGKWKKPSVVTFTLKKQGSKTMVKLTHKDYPEEEHEDLSGGWDDYYFGPMKELLEK